MRKELRKVLGATQAVEAMKVKKVIVKAPAALIVNASEG
jgi:hypothetical protein